MSKLVKQIFKIIVVIIFFIPLSIGTVFGNTSDKYVDTFSYMLSLESNSAVDKFYYSDSYFSHSGKEQSDGLRSMSMVVALATFSSEDKETMSANILEVVKKIGFDDCNIQIDDMEETPQKESIGSVICHKRIGDSDVMLVAIRGERYSLEWASNVLLGNEDDATGFVIARDKILARMKEYIKKNNLQNPKIWITGYSRAASTSNLTGKYINEHLNEFGITDDDLYVYTFEAQNCSTDNVNYANIHNVVDENDIFTYMYPETWNLYLNGVVENIGAKDKFITPNYFSLSFNPIKEAPEVEQKDFISEMADWLGRIVDREDYYEIEGKISDIAYIFASKTNDEIKSIWFHLSFNEWWTIISSIPSFAKIAAKVLVRDLIYVNVDTNERYPFYHALTLLNNYDKIFPEHYGQNIFHLIKLNDNNYIV